MSVDSSSSSTGSEEYVPTETDVLDYEAVFGIDPDCVAAGLGIGFFPKPIVREQTRVRIEHTDMTALLFYQGYSEDEFAI